MLLLFCLVIIAIVAASQYRNGIFTAVTMTIQVMIAGLIAFNFWEPVANQLDEYWQDGKLAGFEDCVALTALFALALGGLRLITNRLNKAMLDFNHIAQQIGGPAIGLVTGYLVSGLVICVLQTLPIEEDFLGFAPRRADEPGLRSYFPADRVWLALMRHAGAYPLASKEENPDAESPFDRWATFDREGTFELRYARYRRHTEKRPPYVYQGELDRELGVRK
jgi:uncharacterized membrane protein required for colicin V production